MIAGNANHELVPTDAGKEIRVLYAFPQDICAVNQYAIARRVAQCVIDLLEVVDIHMEDADSHFALRQGVQLLIQIAPVWQVRQRVVQRVIFHLRPGGFQIGIAQFRQFAGNFQLVSRNHFIGNITISANKPLHAISILKFAGDRLDMPDCVVAANDPEFTFPKHRIVRCAIVIQFRDNTV